MVWGAWIGSFVVGIPQFLSTSGFSISLMQHFARSSVTSVECCTELFEYETHALHAQSTVKPRVKIRWSWSDRWLQQLDKNMVLRFTGDAQKTSASRNTWAVMHVVSQVQHQLCHFRSAPQDKQIAFWNGQQHYNAKVKYISNYNRASCEEQLGFEGSIFAGSQLYNFCSQ